MRQELNPVNDFFAVTTSVYAGEKVNKSIKTDIVSLNSSGSEGVKNKKDKLSKAEALALEKLFKYINDNKTEEVKKILKKYPRLVNRHNNEHIYPLNFAVLKGNLDLVKLFISMGADVNKPNDYGKNTTPLSIAIEKKKLDAVKILINAGADVNYFDRANDLPLSISAIYNSSIEISKLLLKNGAKINARGEYRSTPIGTACSYLGGKYLNIEHIRTILKKWC